MKRKVAVLQGIALCAMSTGSFATNLVLSAGADLKWTDNVFYDDTNKRNDWLETVRVGATADESDSWYELKVGYQAYNQRYQRDSYSAETYYDGSASVLLIPLRNRFDWLFAVDSSTTLSQSNVANTPDNRDQRNTYSTSPRLVLFTSPRNDLILTGSAQKVTFRQSEDSESNRAGGDLAWVHHLSELLSMSVGGSYEKVNFITSEDYKRTRYTLGINKTIKNGSVSLAAGQTKLKPEVSDELDGYNAQAALVLTNEVHTFSFTLSRDLTDTSVAFGDGVNSDSSSSSSSTATLQDVNTGSIDIITRTQVKIEDSYKFTGTDTLSGQLYADNEVSETNNSDTLRRGANIALVHEFSKDLKESVEAGYEKTLEGTDKAKDITKNLKVSLVKNFSQTLNVTGWIEIERADNESNGVTYDANSVGLSVGVQY